MKNNKTTIEDLAPEGKELYQILSYPERTILEWCNKKEKTIEESTKNHLNSKLKAYTGKFKKGDKVRVSRKAESFEGNWRNTWDEEMNEIIGKILTIDKYIEYNNDYKFIDCEYRFPEFVLEKVEPEYYTEENTPIYPDESCWLVSNGWMGTEVIVIFGVWERNVEYDKRHQIKYFSNKENADKYYIELVTKGLIIDKWYKHQYYDIYILFQGDTNCVGFEEGVYKTTIPIRNRNSWMLADLNVVNKLLINKINE